MKKITKDLIVKEQRFTSRIFNNTLFTLIGVTISIMPFIYSKSFDVNLLIGIVVCVVCFGLPFGYFFGLRKLLPTLKEKNALSQGNFSIVVDKVKSSRMLTHGVGSDIGDNYCQIEFENYSSVTGNYYTVTRKMFSKTNNGDEFYLVFIGKIDNTISVFPKKTFMLDDEMKKYFVEEK